MSTTGDRLSVDAERPVIMQRLDLWVNYLEDKMDHMVNCFSQLPLFMRKILNISEQGVLVDKKREAAIIVAE